MLTGLAALLAVAVAAVPSPIWNVPYFTSNWNSTTQASGATLNYAGSLTNNFPANARYAAGNFHSTYVCGWVAQEQVCNWTPSPSVLVNFQDSSGTWHTNEFLWTGSAFATDGKDRLPNVDWGSGYYVTNYPGTVGDGLLVTRLDTATATWRNEAYVANWTSATQASGLTLKYAGMWVNQLPAEARYLAGNFNASYACHTVAQERVCAWTPAPSLLVNVPGNGAWHTYQYVWNGSTFTTDGKDRLPNVDWGAKRYAVSYPGTVGDGLMISRVDSNGWWYNDAYVANWTTATQVSGATLKYSGQWQNQLGASATYAPGRFHATYSCHWVAQENVCAWTPVSSILVNYADAMGTWHTNEFLWNGSAFTTDGKDRLANVMWGSSYCVVGGSSILSTTPPQVGRIYPLFYINSVRYAPPGGTGTKSSTVDYGAGTTTETTTSTGSSFSNKFTVKAGSDKTPIGSSAGTTQGVSNTDSTVITEDLQQDVQVGSLVPSDYVNHDNDEVEIFVNPAIDFVTSPAPPQYTQNSITYNLDFSYVVPVRVKVGWLKGTMSWDPSIYGQLTTPVLLGGFGFQASDIADLWRDVQAADPFAANDPYGWSTPNPDRFVYLLGPIDYAPGLADVANAALSDSVAISHSKTTTVTYTVSASVTLGGILNVSDEYSWTNTNTNSDKVTNKTTEKYTVNMPSPAFKGPSTTLYIYKDTVFDTFMFSFVPAPGFPSAPPYPGCIAGFALDGDICINITSDLLNCGGVGNMCADTPNGSAVCVNASCGVVCDAGYSLVNGGCVAN